MSKLNVDQKTIFNLLSDKSSDFLIPDYQRPYAWGEEQCQTLWDDIVAFSFPDDNIDEFDDNEEYFLGAIVTFKNEKGKLEVIDGQQRLTTLLLMLRAFYDKFKEMKDENSILMYENIGKCIWKTNKFGKIDTGTLKIDSEVATDNDKEEFLEILKNGLDPSIVSISSKSAYVQNYRFFEQKINEFLNQSPSYFVHLPANILNNCILLPIEAESQDTALRIFSTLNDRGLPLSDSDIFKAQFYRYYNDQGNDKKDEFINRWKQLEEYTEGIFSSSVGTPMDELFTRYMYYLRAKEGNKRSTVEALRKFYERNKYQYLKQKDTLDELESLASFWQDIRDRKVFSEKIARQLFILENAPNGMWEYIVSVYFLQNKDLNGKLDDKAFNEFLGVIIGFIFALAVINPGVNALRTPIFDEMISIVKNKAVKFEKYRFDKKQAVSFFYNYSFSNSRRITRSMVTWHAFTYKGQELPLIGEKYDIEHIYARQRQYMENGLEDPSNLESIGNKILLEKSINISASDYSFKDKKKIYTGEMRRGRDKNPTKIYELLEIAKRDDFTENDIKDRKVKMLKSFFSYLEDKNLLK